MNTRSCNAILIFAVATVSLIFVPEQVKAQKLNSASAGDLDPVMPATTVTSSVFLVAHPDADFTALPGRSYFILKCDLTCTLSSARSAAGKEIIITPSYKSAGSVFIHGIAIKTTGDEQIYSCFNGKRYLVSKWSKYNPLGSCRFISDGENWYLISCMP